MSEPHKPVGAIFDAALELPPERRAAYVQEACAGDDALRQRVEALLSAHESAEAFMDHPAVDLRREPIVVKPAEQPGDRIGRYKLLQQIGEGGCGVVYMAEQEEPVRRRVALKVIKLGMDTRQVIARFEAERQALALMDHPNIAKVLDAGATDTGRPYFVMELVRGVKITDYCDQHNLSTRERLDLFIQICHAIQHAHQKGIIHRDIKPSNILVTMNDGVPVPKVIDFGIAKATQGKLTDQTLFTAFEQLIGTPAYMSPEQAELSAHDIDTRSDIYSLGVLLYELLTGQTPFDARKLLEAGLDEIRRTIREQEPAPPSTRLSTMLAAELTATAQHRKVEPPRLIHLVRGDLDWIVMKCLEKDRARRYDTANGLAMDIARHLNCEPVLARPPSRLYEFQKTVRRHKFGFASAAGIIVTLIIGLGVCTWLLLKEKEARKRAVIAEQAQTLLRKEAESSRRDEAKQREQAQTEASKSHQVAQFLEEMLKGVGPSVARGRDTKLLREILDKTRYRLNRDLTNQPAVEVELGTTLTDAYLDLEVYQEAESMARKTLSLSRSCYGEDRLPTARILVALGSALYGLGISDQALAFMRTGLSIQRKLLPGDNPEVANSLDKIADLLRRYDDVSEAVVLQREGLEMKRRLFGNEDPTLCPSLNTLGFLLMDRKATFPEAEAMFREALRLHEKHTGKEDPDAAICLGRLGKLVAIEGRLGEGETMLREALAIQRKVLGAEISPIAWTLEDLAEVLHDEGKFEECGAMFREALAMKRKQLGNDHPDVTYSVERFVEILRREGKFDELETLFREALILARAPSTNGPTPEARSVGVLLHHLADVLREQKKLTEARSFAQEAVEMYQRHADWPLNERQHAIEVLGQVLRDSGDFAGAEALCRNELERMRGQLPAEAPELARVIAHLAYTLLAQEKFAEAEPLARECLAIREKRIPQEWRTFEARSMLGDALWGQKKYAEAEPLLLSGYEGMEQRQGSIPAMFRVRLQEALQRLVQLYEAKDRPVQATEWRRKLAKFGKTEK